MTFYEELSGLLVDVANRVDRWTGDDAWTFEPGSPASIEVANVETRLGGSPWGERPVRTVYQLAQMATKYTVEMSRCVASLVGATRPAPGIEVLTRSSLEAASVVWWLLADGLTARQRVCRMQLLRRNSALELAKSITEVGEDPSVAGNETVAAIEAGCHDLGLASFGNKGDELEGEIRLRYTARVKKLTDELGYQGAYSIYSGAAHAELTGLWRLFQQTATTFPERAPIYTPAPDPRATFAAVDGALKSMMGPIERIALLFGWTAPGRAEEVGATIDYMNSEMARLRVS
jgi:hypothetical protein